jgi:hypothetical protein
MGWAEPVVVSDALLHEAFFANDPFWLSSS